MSDPSPSPTVQLAPTIASQPPTATALVEDVSTSTPAPTRTPLVSPTATLGPNDRAVSVRRGPPTSSVVALSYDAGADRGLTPDLLVTLAEADVKVTFGMTGRWAESNPDLVRRIQADGHEFMNHTYNHLSFTGISAKPVVLTRAERFSEIGRAETIIQSLAGVSPRPLFRPPYGDEDDRVLLDVAAAGYRYSILWTVDSGGWEGHSISQIVTRCISLVEAGAIYVLHVGGLSHDIEATAQVIEGIRAKGYEFVTVGELLGVQHDPVPVDDGSPVPDDTPTP